MQTQKWREFCLSYMVISEKGMLSLCSPLTTLKQKNISSIFKEIEIWCDAIFVLMLNAKFKSLKELSSVDSHRYVFILLNH